jgi:cytochrome c
MVSFRHINKRGGGIMKKLIFSVIAMLVLASVGFAGDHGEAVFEAQRCGVCHKPDTGKMNLSLREIAEAYQGKEEQLIKYLKGEAEPMIRPEKADMMKRSVEKTKGLTDEERRALAVFMLGYGK